MPQARKWQLTVNNPQEHGLTHDVLRESLAKFSGMVYWCMADEIGEQETYHTHIYLVLRTPTNHTVFQNRFPGVHREIVRGTSQQNRDYVTKDGEKYNKQPDGTYDYTDSAGKQHKGTSYASTTFEEWGELPHEHQGKSKDVEQILALVQDGASNQEIVLSVPSAMMNLDKVERTRSMFRDAQFASCWRNLEVSYIFGATGAGKTRSVMDTFGYDRCYRVTDYKHPFDTYDGQDVLIFEEFRSQFKISDILNYFDGYPLLLPCRYFNRQACYTKVFLISNVPLEHQYASTASESRAAFLRRIRSVVMYLPDGERRAFPSVDDDFNRTAAQELALVFG